MVRKVRKVGKRRLLKPLGQKGFINIPFNPNYKAPRPPVFKQSKFETRWY